MTLRLRAIIPPKILLDAEAMSRAIENTLDNTAKNIKVDFDVTTQTWNERPDFEIEKRAGYRFIGTENEIYGYLNFGTRVRYALMSPDFSPKTRRGYIGSNKGRGGVILVSRRHPRPGIEAREFDKAVQAKWEGLMQNTFQRAIDAEVSRASR